VTLSNTSGLFWLALSVPGAAFASSIINLFIKEKNSNFTPIVSSVCLLIATICSVILFSLLPEGVFLFEQTWFIVNHKTIHIGFLLDGVATSMMLVVTLISFLVHVFSSGYMSNDQSKTRFFGMLGFFTFAMLGLVMSSNLLMMFCFWELVGFSSYRLIGHWFEKPAAAKASTKAFIINRVGDLGFLIGLMILWAWLGHLDINSLNLQSVQTFWLTTSGICIFLGVVGKSAQFPLLNWLPDAMEGPTPVSALIHAATMVAAGVFLLVRISDLFTADVLMIISLTGTLTAIAGALGALFQYDLKKILAYSTISQLGFMVMAVGSGSIQGSYMHLLHHAFFKAGLFLGAGAIIHAIHHTNKAIDAQDIRNLGGLRKKMPVTFITFTICSAALAGVPLTSGFVSKELILTQMGNWAEEEFSWKWIVLMLGWSTTFLTPLYTVRLVWYVFFGKRNTESNIREVPLVMKLPLVILAAASVAILISFNPFHISSFISLLLPNSSHPDFKVTIISLITLSGALAFGFLYFKKRDLTEPNRFLAPQFYLDWFTNHIVTRALIFSNSLSWLDRNIIDRVIHWFAYTQVILATLVGKWDKHVVDGLVNGVAWSAKGAGALARSVVNGKIQSYLLWALASLIIFILWILF
jgi:NADH-quinone oxidoreductase subunit L